jgi:4-amino-4-deoxy-L-arabinose transferase-like glycosyltransferase
MHLTRFRPLSGRDLALLLIVAVILGGAVARAEVIGTNTFVSADEIGYAGDANRILAHERYGSFKWAPGTPAVFALFARAAGYHSLKITTHAHGPAQDAQLAIEVLTLVLVALIAWMLAGPWAALIAVALTAAYIPLVLVTRSYLSEPLGGLMLLAALASGALARTRRLPYIAGAGAVAGLACLARNDLAVGMAVIAVAIALAGRPPWRTAACRLAVYLGCLALVVAPWVIYASQRNGRFVPITTSGPNALFIGTYLPGHGEQFQTVATFRGAVCAREPTQCAHFRPGYTAPMFRLIASRYPHLSENRAATEAALENLRKYALGQPFAFTGMMWEKFWHLWSYPWSGGNSGLHPDTSRTQHVVFFLLAWVGLLGGAVVLRRFELIAATAVLLAVSLLNMVFVAQARDNVRLAPTLLTYGAAGLWLLITKRLVPGLKRRREAAAGPPQKSTGPVTVG